MPSIPDNQISIGQVTMKGLITAGGSSAVNTQFVFHYRRTSTVPALSKSALSAAFQAGPAVAIIAALNARWSQKTNDIRWVNDALDQDQPFANVNVGGVAGDSLASHNAIFTLFRTGIRGRSYRGGKHFGPLSEADVTTAGDDVLNAAAITRFTAILTALALTLTDANTNQWKLCVLSRHKSQLTQNPTTVVTNDVQTLLLNKRVANMKRRQVASVY